MDWENAYKIRHETSKPRARLAAPDFLSQEGFPCYWEESTAVYLLGQQKSH